MCTPVNPVLLYKSGFQVGSKLYWYIFVMIGFFSSQGDVTLRQIIRSRQNIRSGHVSNSAETSSTSTLSARFRNIRSKLNLFDDGKVRDYFSSQGDVTLCSIIRTGQFSNWSEITCMPTLCANFRKIQSKLKELCWWQALSYHKPIGYFGC